MDGFPEKYSILKPEQFINKVKHFARFLTRQETEVCLSEHRGASVMLDEALQAQLPFEPHAVSEGWLPFDSEGCYIDPTDI